MQKPYNTITPKPLILKLVGNLIILSLIFSQSTAYATTSLPITPDGSTNTTIHSAPNGVPVINIAAPNAGGLSHNKYTNYNVNQQGLILNNSVNSPKGVVSTQIGGIILDNHHLKSSGAASVILNEVTSTNKTYLNGYTEIAGQRADLIIANPNGISVNGAGFINTSRLTTIVGSANQHNSYPGNLTFSLRSEVGDNGFLPSLTISGSGIDLEEVSETDLVANIMNIVSPIYGGENTINLRAGDNQFSYQDKSITSIDATNINSLTSIAIDASMFGGIQAGKIFIIATKEGFGVKYSANMLASRGGVTIDAKGNVEYNNIASSSGDINITSKDGSILVNSITYNASANHSINLSASDNITNNGQLISDNDISIITDSNFINNNSVANIAANDFSIISNNLLNNGILVANNDININTSSLTSNQGEIISSNNFLLNSSTITNDNILLSSGKMTINTSGHLINNAQILGDSIDRENDNIKITSKSIGNNGFIIANSNIELIASDDIQNNGTISSEVNLGLKSINGDINNNEYAEIIGGNGEVSFMAINGALNQLSDNSIVVNGDLTLDVFDFTNTGRVDIAGYSTLNVKNDLTNEEGALIYSGNDMTLNIANNLTNKKNALIYAENDLTIQKYSEVDDRYDASNNKINTFDNLSGEIISYSGDVSIEAETINNKSYVQPFNSLINPGGNLLSGPSSNYNDIKHYSWDHASFGCFGNKCSNVYNGYYAKQLTNSEYKAAKISAGGSLNINAENFLNEASIIESVNNMSITAQTLNNYSLYDAGLYKTHLQDSVWIYSLSTTHQFTIMHSQGAYYGPYVDYKDYDQSFPSYIKSGGDITLNVANNISNTPVDSNSNNVQILQRTPAFINNIDVSNLLESGIIDSDLSYYVDGDYYQGMFKKSEDPNYPLFETRSEFVDQSKFFGSNYFYEKIGLNLEEVIEGLKLQNQRLVGDQFFQNKIINDQLRIIKKNNFLLSDSNTDSSTETKDLIDNAVSEYARLGLTENKSLTQDQINKLEKNIIWFETQEISGQIYIVPKIYLTQATRDNIKNKDSLASQSTIFANNNLTINSVNGAITNQGSIFGVNVAISANGNFLNSNFSNITAIESLDIASHSGSVINKSEINSTVDLTINANKSVYNLATIKTNAQNLLDKNLSHTDTKIYQQNSRNATNSGNISSTLVETAAISGGNVTISAGSDFNNLAANIDATGDLLISSGDDINISTLQLRERSEQNWGSRSKGGSSIIDTTTNVSSNISAGRNLSLASTGDTLIRGSHIDVAGEATINTIGDLNIFSATDTYYKSISNHKKGSFSRKSSSSLTESSITNVMPNIYVGDDINSNSQKNINIIASNITSGGDINLEAALAINIVAGQDINYLESTSNKKGTTIIKSSDNVAYYLDNVHSNLNAGADISITAGTDINFIGTNLEVGKNIEINAGDQIMIAAVADESYQYSNSSKTRSMVTIAKYTGISKNLQVTSAIVDVISGSIVNPDTYIATGVISYFNNLTEGDLNSKISSNIVKTKTYKLSDLKAGNNLNIESNNNINLIGTNIDAVDVMINSNYGDVNISNVKDAYYSKNNVQKSKTTATSIATDVAKLYLFYASTSLISAQMMQHPDAREQRMEENTQAMGQQSQKQFTQINSLTNETIVASTINSANLTINSGRDTVITSSNIHTRNDFNINSANNTIIASDYENDSSLTLREKKSPNIVAAISNGLVKLVGDITPDFSFKKYDKKEELQKQQAENDSLDRNHHSQDISVATKTDNAMVNGYTISNDDADEISYDTKLDKRTTKTKTYISSNITSQNNIYINSVNGDNTIIAANITANNDININSLNGETIITSATNESFESTLQVRQDYNDISTNYGGRISLDAEMSIYEKDIKNINTTQLSSNLTSGNSINISTKDDINILSSHLNSNNEINLNSTEGSTNIGANKNTKHSEIEIREGTLTLSAGVGNSAIDAAYAVDDTVKAAEKLKEAKQNLKRMKRLQKEGKATKDAVGDAEMNLHIASLNVALSILKVLSAAEKVKKTKATYGFYGDVKLTRNGDKTNITSNSSQDVASILLSQNAINISSGSSLVSTASKKEGNTNIKGNVESINSDINIKSFNNTNIESLRSDSSSSAKSEGFTQTVTLGASYSESKTDKLIYALSAQISKRSSKSDSSSNTYANTNISANNGTININSINHDTNIIGANLSANNININSGNDLNVASIQNTSRYKSRSRSIGAGRGSNSISLRYNSNRSNSEKNWVDDQTSIIAQNSLTINTAKNTDVKGAVVASNTNNLLINTGTLTYRNIIDTTKQESNGFGISANISVGERSQKSDARNSNQDKSYFPNGSVSISLSNEGYEREQITRATIGLGTINVVDTKNQEQDIAGLNRDTNKVQEITKDTITGALNVSTTIDNRLIAVAFRNKGAQDSLLKTTIEGAENLEHTAKELWAATATPYTIAGAAYGLTGHLYSHTLGNGKADFYYNSEYNTLEFESNPLVTRPFTTGHVINYSNSGNKYGGPERLEKYSYSGSMLTPNGYSTTRMHENGHVTQYDNWGILFGPSYVGNGIYNDYIHNGGLNLNNHWNYFERDADSLAKQTKMKK